MLKGKALAQRKKRIVHFIILVQRETAALAI